MDDKDRFEILKIELSLIQGTFDKYDDLIFRSRNFFITLWLACIGLAFTINSQFIPLLAIFLSVLYWFLEGMMRHQYWYKYVGRYRYLRNNLNRSDFNISDITIYDLTNQAEKDEECWCEKIRKCFFKLEPTISYFVMGVAAFVIWILLHEEVVKFPAKTCP